MNFAKYIYVSKRYLEKNVGIVQHLARHDLRNTARDWQLANAMRMRSNDVDKAACCALSPAGHMAALRLRKHCVRRHCCAGRILAVGTWTDRQLTLLRV